MKLACSLQEIQADETGM